MTTTALLLGLSLNGAAFTRESPCDLPGNDLGGKDGLPAKADTVDACEQRCAALDACAAYAFISGCNRCFPKAKAGKSVPVRLFAGEMKVGHVAVAGFDRDYTGKDLRRVEHVASGEACGKLCEAEPKCQAFAYIGGYADCWLKKDRGNPREKVFSCGVKNH